MTKPAIPPAVLPAYKRDPRKILCLRACGYCGAEFPVVRKFPAARFCSRRCGLRCLALTSEHQARAGRVGGKVRAVAIRGKGSRGWYIKLGSRHTHRVIAEEKLRRPLKPGEIVHLLDRNKTNYAMTNLRIFPSRSAFARYLRLAK